MTKVETNVGAAFQTLTRKVYIVFSLVLSSVTDIVNGEEVTALKSFSDAAKVKVVVASTNDPAIYAGIVDDVTDKVYVLVLGS